MRKKYQKKFFINKQHILIAVYLLLVLTPVYLFAAGKGFVPLEALPGITNTNDSVKYFNSLFRLGVVIAGFLAVFMIVVGGFKYMSTDSVSGKGEAKETITAALSGLFLILISVILLQIINPDILSFNLFR